MQLIVHIGAGKTGTSAIQHALAAHPDALAARHARYLGLMLEHAPGAQGARRPWQKASGSEIFHGMPRAQAVEELCTVLRAAVIAAAADGMARLLWSNESLFDRHAAVDVALRRLAEDGVQVRVIAYVRDPVAWTRSAYLQWGIRHKTYPGPIRPFTTWAESHAPRFAQVLDEWAADWGEALVVRNYDAVDDVVPDFLAACGLDGVALAPTRANDTPAPHDLLLRAIYNGRLADRALPQRFDRQFGPQGPGGGTPAGRLAALLPDAQALVELARRVAPDRERVDARLRAAGQPPLPDAESSVSACIQHDVSRPLDESRLLMALCELVVAQGQRIERLEHRLREMDGPDAGLSSPAVSIPGLAARAVAGSRQPRASDAPATPDSATESAPGARARPPSRRIPT